MYFVHHDLGSLSGDEVVEITLSGNAADVRLMDSPNFSSYRKGLDHRYTGGLTKKSPVHLQVPNSGHWHVVMDMQGLRGTTQSSVRVLA